MSKHICKSIRQQLPDYLDEKLVECDAERIRAHLADCAQCRAEAERLRPLMQDLLPAAREESAGVDWGRFLTDVNEGIDACAARKKPAYGVHPGLALVSATIVFALIAVWMLLRPFSGSDAGDPLLAEDFFDAREVEVLSSLTDDADAEIPEAVTENSPQSSSLAVISEEATDVGDGELLDIADAQIIDALGEEEAVSAGMEYLSDTQVLESLSESDVALIASLLESENLKTE